MRFYLLVTCYLHSWRYSVISFLLSDFFVRHYNAGQLAVDTWRRLGSIMSPPPQLRNSIYWIRIRTTSTEEMPEKQP